MRVFAFAAIAAIAISGSASAADRTGPANKRPVYKAAPMPVPADPGWNGFYLGANVGGGFAYSDSEFSVTGGPRFATVSNRLLGPLVGAQAGYNWQADAAVFGVEADIQYGNVRGSLTAPCIPGACASYDQKLPWFGTVRARAGYTSGGWLFYATGGYAYARPETDAYAGAGPLTAVSTHGDNVNGWTAGTGIEVMLGPHWSAKLEYLYIDFGKVRPVWAFTGLPSVVDDAHWTMNVVRAGVNYRF